MSVPCIFLSSWLSVCQKLSNLVEICQSCDKKKLGHFLAHPVQYTVEYVLEKSEINQNFSSTSLE